MKELNRSRMFRGEDKLEFKRNFREDLAVTKVYKGNRVKSKPFHFNNLTVYLMARYNTVIANGMEADDLLGITQVSRGTENTVICSRDKDLRMIPGWHYSWECGRQASIGPYKAEPNGELIEKGNGKILGYGFKFFLYQMLVGDTVDNIPGVPGIGPVKAYKKLTQPGCDDPLVAYQEVVKAYQEAFPEDWKTHIREMADLLWIVREIDGETGLPVKFNAKEFFRECRTD